MTIRNEAIKWLKVNFPKEINNQTRTSKFFPERDLWFFTFPISFFEKNDWQFLNIICEHDKISNDFYFIKVPFKFIKENKNNFSIRSDGGQFDLHISAKAYEKFIEKRSKNPINFKQYIQNSL